MQPVFTAEEMRALDRRAITELDIPGSHLMEQAGRGAAAALLEALPALGRRARGLRVVVLCGKGGNGGDGFVVARWLARAGARPSVFLAAPASELTGDPAAKYRQMRRAGVSARTVNDARAVRAALARADVVVDGLLGTGARGAPSPLVAELIEAMNAAGRPVLALDVPSGLPAEGETAAWPVVRAWMTATFAGLKRGLVLGDGPALAGQVTVVSIGIPPGEVGRGIDTFLLEASDVAPLFPPRVRDAHKGDYGHLLVVAGSVGKTGAAALCARAAMRAGAGLVTVATPAPAQPVVASLILEAMSHPLPATGDGTASLAARDIVLELAAARDAVALGPGLGLADETQQLARALIREAVCPVAVDADALTACAGHLDLLREAPAPRCLTPHPGEMARMLGTSVAEVQRDRLATVRHVATKYQIHVLLKGARTLVARPDGRVVINPTGNPGMASGGTGDVLTGIVGAFLARGLSPDDALPAAAYLHGLAGDVGAARLGEEALVAGDLVDALGDAFGRLRHAP